MPVSDPKQQAAYTLFQVSQHRWRSPNYHEAIRDAEEFARITPVEEFGICKGCWSSFRYGVRKPCNEDCALNNEPR